MLKALLKLVLASGGTAGVVAANGYGYIVDKILIPTTDDGTYVITATGTAADGGLRVDSTIVTVVPP